MTVRSSKLDFPRSRSFGFGRSAAWALAAAVLLGGASTAVCAASASDETPSIVVKYGDLDLSRDAGVQALYARIRGAARQVCPVDDPRDLHALAASQACQAAATSRAIAAIRNPHFAERLAAIAARRSARS